MRILLMLLALGGAAAGQAQEAPAADVTVDPAEMAAAIRSETRTDLLVGAALGAYQAKDYTTMQLVLERVVELRPYLADLKFMLARAYALQDRKTEAYNTLTQLSQQGLSFDMDGDADFENLRGFQLYDFIQEQFARNAAPFGAATTAFRIEETDLLIESIAHDPTGERFLVGSVTTGQILAIGKDGTLTRFIRPDQENGLLGVTALAVDNQRGRLWVTSTGSLQARHTDESMRGASRLHAFELATGKHLLTVDAPVKPILFIDIAVAADGRLFIADATKPIVWAVEDAATDAPKLEPFFSGRGLTGIRALTLDTAGGQLYLADYELGLFGIDLQAQQLYPIQMGEMLNLAGIDDVAWYEDSLVLVQNGVKPRRVLRLQLDPSHRRALHVQAVESAHPSFRNPVAGTLGPDGFFLIANSHRNEYDPRTGSPRPGIQLTPHTVLRIDPTFSWDPQGARAPAATIIEG